MPHSRLSPSSSSRWMACPGSVAACQAYPDTSSKAADDGTLTHHLLEYCIKNQVDEMEVRGGTLTHDSLGEYFVDDDRAERVQVALDYIAKQMSKLQDATLGSEARVDAGKWISRTDLDGTCDVDLVCRDSIEVVDYKDGVGQVRAEDNTQLLIYLLGAVGRRVHPVDPLTPAFSHLRITIIQPKMAIFGNPQVSSVQVTWDELMIFKDRLALAAAATDAPNALRVPGETQCQWCPHKPNCQEFQDKALGEAHLLFGDDKALLPVEEIANVEPTLMDDSRLVEQVEAVPLLKMHIEAIMDEALRRLKEGPEVRGLKLVRGRGSRKWKVGAIELLRKFKSLGIPKGKWYPENPLSPAQIEKVTWVNSKDEEKKLTSRQLKALASTFIEKIEGQLTVALESDPRESVVPDVQKLFADTRVANGVQFTETADIPAAESPKVTITQSGPVTETSETFLPEKTIDIPDFLK